MKPVFSVAYGIIVLCDCPRKLLTYLNALPVNNNELAQINEIC
jgi:hypothetical protein